MCLWLGLGFLLVRSPAVLCDKLRWKNVLLAGWGCFMVKKVCGDGASGG
jgi:hypothetical protein